MSTYRKYIKHLIEQEIRRIIVEQDLPEEPVEAAPTDTPESTGKEGDTETTQQDTTTDPSNATPTSLSTNNAGTSELAGSESDNLGGDLEGGEEGTGEGPLVGGMGMPKMSSSGGFSFGNKGEPGLVPDAPGDAEEESKVTTVGPEDVEMPDDPVMAVADEAIELLKITRQPNVILKSVKSSLQKYFSDFEEATPVIKVLWDSEDPTLRDVARRLLLFIRGI